MAIRFMASIIGFGRRGENLLNRLNRERMRQAMEDSLQLIMQSTMIGFMQEKDPDGNAWQSNPDWWETMKGQSTVLTGPVGKTIMGGQYAKNYEFKSPNPTRMRNNLIKSNSTFSGYVTYTQAAKKRAEINQYGGTGEIKLSSKTGGRDIVFNVQVVERPHLGVATYPRVPNRTDAGWIEFYFGEQVDIQLRDDLTHF